MNLKSESIGIRDRVLEIQKEMKMFAHTRPTNGILTNTKVKMKLKSESITIRDLHYLKFQQKMKKLTSTRRKRK